MKLADFFINVGVKGDTAKLKDIDKTIDKMEKASKKEKEIAKYRKELAKATTKEEKAQVKKNFADKVKLENLRKQKAELTANKSAFLSAAKGAAAFVGAVVIAYGVMDRMASALARTNQQMITFNRTTGISFSSLNRYAAANAAVNYNSSIEGTAQSMQRVAQNLWDIRMGRGDVSPYQELAYVGGKAFNPMGMSVEQVIESVRDAIKGVDDLQATNIITRMGFSPDDLLMLRMSREEFEKINSLFLSPRHREAMNQYALQMKQTQLQFGLLKDKALLKIIPLFINLSKWLADTATFWGEVTNRILKFIDSCTLAQNVLKSFAGAFGVVLAVLHPIIAGITAIYLLIEDIAYGIMGYDSYTRDLFNFIDALGEKIANSKVGQFFKSIKDGIAGLANMHIPAWLAGLFTFHSTPTPALASANYAPYANGISNSTTNNDNQLNLNIQTNQPIDTVMQGLVAAYPQYQFAYGIKQ